MALQDEKPGKDGTAKAWRYDGSITPDSRRHIFTELLKSASREFYRPLRVLPSGLREVGSIGWMLARAVDTITDASSLSTERRVEHLRKFRRIIAGEEETAAVAELTQQTAYTHSTAGERELMGRLPTILALMKDFDEADQAALRKLVMTLISGMLFDINTFHSDDNPEITAIDSADRLEEYCYLVAGCAGEFGADISYIHTPSLASWDMDEMRDLGIRFGNALQMTNILRDIPMDLQIGRCYLPKDELEKANLRPDDLLDSANSSRARPTLIWGIRKTLELFSAGETYMLAIPRRNLRLRLASLWAILIGLATLAKLASIDDWLNPERRVKVPRRAVYGMVALSLLCGRSNFLTRLWIRRIRRRVERAIQPH